jgi:peptide/nickel transport system substrate-binding protein
MRGIARTSLLAALTATAMAVFCPLQRVAAQQPKQGGVLTHVVESEPNSIDCHASATSFTIQLVAPHYSTLLKYDPAAYPKIVGDLAESWLISPDGMTYTFKLLPDVLFHDGSALTAADIKATYERLRNPPEGIISARQEQFVDIDSIETPDPLTVIFKLKKPNAAFLSLLASPWNCVYSAKKLAEDPNYPAKQPMGTGPFKFVEYVKGSHWTGERFEGYFRKGHPYLDGIKAVFISGAGVINALAGGQVDGTFFLLSPASAKRLEQSLGNKMIFPTSSFNITTFVTVNTTKPPFDNPKIRKALNLALDRREATIFLKDLANIERPALLMPTAATIRTPDAEIMKLPGFNDDAKTTVARREQAKALLKEAGQEKLKVVLLNRNIRTPWEPLGVYVLDQLRKIGVDATQILAETPQYFSMLRDRSYDLAIDFNNTTGVDPNEVLIKFLPGSPNNYSGAKDDHLTEIFNKQSQLNDDELRQKLVRDFEMRTLEQGYVLPIFNGDRLIAYYAYVKGFQLMPSTVLGLDMGDVWLDK